MRPPKGRGRGRGRPPPPWQAQDPARAAYEYYEGDDAERYDEWADEEFGGGYEWDGDDDDFEPVAYGDEWYDDGYDEAFWEDRDGEWWWTSEVMGGSCRLVQEPATDSGPGKETEQAAVSIETRPDAGDNPAEEGNRHDHAAFGGASEVGRCLFWRRASRTDLEFPGAKELICGRP